MVDTYSSIDLNSQGRIIKRAAVVGSIVSMEELTNCVEVAASHINYGFSKIT